MLYIKEKADIGKLLFKGKEQGIRIRVRDSIQGSLNVFDLDIENVRKLACKDTFNFIISIAKPIKLTEYKGMLVSNAETAQDKFVEELEDEDAIKDIIESIESLILYN